METGVSRFARSKLVVILTGVVMIGLGIAIFLNPIAAVESLVRIIGWVNVGFGIVSLVSALMKGNPVSNAPSELAIGAVCVVFGLWMAMMPNTFVTVVWSFLGAIVLATGVLDVIEASRAKGQGSSLAGLAFVFGCFTAVLGMVLIMSPFLFSELAMLIAAIVLLIDGMSELVFGLGL